MKLPTVKQTLIVLAVLACLQFVCIIDIMNNHRQNRYERLNRLSSQYEESGWSSDAAYHIASVELGLIPADSLYIAYMQD